jgi:hypothetical protein
MDGTLVDLKAGIESAWETCPALAHLVVGLPLFKATMTVGVLS